MRPTAGDVDVILDVSRMQFDEHGVRAFVWPLAREEILAMRDAVVERLVVAARGDTVTPDEDAELLSILSGYFVLEAMAVYQAHALCRRFAGFGIDRVVPEQSAALRALAVIGSRDAAQAVSLLIVRGVVQGPALGLAVAVAARLHASLPADVLRSLLRHADPDIRANACHFACRRPELIAVMIDLLDDLNHAVARSAACALGQ